MSKRVAENTSSPTKKSPKKPLQILLDEDVHRVLRMRCSHDGRSLSDVVGQALREWLKAQPPMRPAPLL
jgi:uncharacterized protein (DUF4415 family)